MELGNYLISTHTVNCKYFSGYNSGIFQNDDDSATDYLPCITTVPGGGKQGRIFREREMKM